MFDVSLSESSHGAQRRRSLRRAVSLACEVRCDLWDGPVRFAGTNLSPEGMWLETVVPLELGEELLVTFSPPGQFLRLHALCEVRRVGLWRRAADPWSAGMGVVFTDLTGADRDRLARALIGIPPPLPVTVALPRPSAPPPLPITVSPMATREPAYVLPPVLDPWLASTCEQAWAPLSGLMTGGCAKA